MNFLVESDLKINQEVWILKRDGSVHKCKIYGFVNNHSIRLKCAGRHLTWAIKNLFFSKEDAKLAKALGCKVSDLVE